MTRAERVTRIIWLGWFIACITGNNWIILVISILGITVNTFLLRKKEKQLLAYIIGSGILLFTATGNLLLILSTL